MTLRELIVALQFLTRLPVPRLENVDADELSRGALWFPLVGALIGALVALAVAVGGYFDPWLGALFGLLTWVLVTGALHLDGLSDVADALGAAHRSRERFLAVLRDPHVGTFGVTAIVLAVASKLVLLAVLAEKPAFVALILVTAWARWGVLYLALVLRPLSDGMGARFASRIDGRAVVISAAVLTLLSAFLAPVLIGGLVAAVLLAVFWRLGVGGFTGDCLGASIEVTEIVLLVLLVIAG